MAAILDVANMTAPVLIRLDAHQKSNKYGLGNIYANMVLLEESEPNTIYDALTAPTTTSKAIIS